MEPLQSGLLFSAEDFECATSTSGALLRAPARDGVGRAGASTGTVLVTRRPRRSSRPEHRTVIIDDEQYQVEDGQNLLEACLSLGFDLPFFCWHPALGSVGACRQCAVKQLQDRPRGQREGKIVMACMTPAQDGTRISIDDPEARPSAPG